MRRILFFLAVVLVGGGAYLAFKYFWNPTTAPVFRLSQFIDAHVESIFAPISASGTPASGHQLRQLRELFKNHLNRGEGNEQAMLSAIRLCDTLMLAIKSREDHMQRLRAAQTSSYVSMESTAFEKHKDKESKKAFFSGAVMDSWTRESQRLRKKIDADYALLRSYER